VKQFLNSVFIGVMAGLILAQTSWAGATFSRNTTWSDGQTLTASALNAEFDNILNNLDPDGIDDASANTTAMQSTADPYPGGAESLATNLEGELHRLRYLIKQISGEAQWYIDTDTDLATIDAHLAKICEGRLTLADGVAVSTSDLTARTTIYFTPYKGNQVALYNGTKWFLHTLTQISTTPAGTTNQMYDLFITSSATLEQVAWTNDTTRATALTTQNGVYVKSGDATRRYLGSYRTTGSSGQTEDSAAKRYLWNYYNRVVRKLKVVEGTDTWTYTIASWRQANNSTANQVDAVIGVVEDVVEIFVSATVGTNNAGVSMRVGIGVDSATVNSADITISVNNDGGGRRQNPFALYRGYPSAGRHYYTWLEWSTAAGVTTWIGDDGDATIQQSGITGSIFG
jgi:hypothetical protein